MRVVIFSIAIFFLNGVSGCSESRLSPDKYIGYVDNKENGLVIERTFDGVQFQAQYRPADYLASVDLLRNPALAYGEVIKEIDSLQYFCFRIGNESHSDDVLKRNITTGEEYIKRLEYLAFAARNDFMLVSGNDSLRCSLYHFERSHNLAPYHTIIMAFPAIKRSDLGRTLSYNDQLFGSGRINFHFASETVSKIPKLIIQ